MSRIHLSPLCAESLLCCPLAVSNAVQNQDPGILTSEAKSIRLDANLVYVFCNPPVLLHLANLSGRIVIRQRGAKLGFWVIFAVFRS